jgi:hypothetical protein
MGKDIRLAIVAQKLEQTQRRASQDAALEEPISGTSQSDQSISCC